MTEEELARYMAIGREAARRQLSDQEKHEWNALGLKYAVVVKEKQYLRSDAQDRNQAIGSTAEQIGAGAMYYDRTHAKEPPERATPEYEGDPYDEGTTPGKYRKARSDDDLRAKWLAFRALVGDP